MKRLVFECRLISPLASFGLEQTTPELRTPAFKGLLRFWWRAVQAEADIQKLRSAEAKIFGRTTKEGGKNLPQQSSFRLLITSNERRISSRRLLPYHMNGRKDFQVQTIVGATFTVEFSLLHEQRTSIEDLQTLFELFSLLGGVGKRARRGFGSFQILKVNGNPSDFAEINSREEWLKQILQRLNYLTEGKYDITQGKIRIKHSFEGEYPYIQEVDVGHRPGKEEDVLRLIDKAAHEWDSVYTGSIKPRFASPEYVSLVGDKEKCFPVVTSLHLAFSSDLSPRLQTHAVKSGEMSQTDRKYQDFRTQFREAILNG